MNAYTFTIEVSTNATVCVVSICLCFAWVAWHAHKRAALRHRKP